MWDSGRQKGSTGEGKGSWGWYVKLIKNLRIKEEGTNVDLWLPYVCMCVHVYIHTAIQTL